jgi:DNA-directed RNA polymerase specialized sigma24 family protein
MTDFGPNSKATDANEASRFVQENMGKVYRFTLRIVGDQSTAQDVTDYALGKTYRDWNQIRSVEPDSHLHWCVRIASERSIEVLKNRR